MRWRNAVLVWCLIAVAETVHGVLREFFIVPLVGDLAARQLGVAAGSAIILVIAWATAEFVGAQSPRQQLGVGLLWVVLTVAFEFGLGMIRGFSFERVLADYNVAEGGFMLFGLAFMLVSLMLACNLRNRFRASPRKARQGGNEK